MSQYNMLRNQRRGRRRSSRPQARSAGENVLRMQQEPREETAAPAPLSEEPAAPTEEPTAPAEPLPQEPHLENEGRLRFTVRASSGFVPIRGATITIVRTEEPEQIMGVLHTDESGRTPTIVLPTPPIDYSLAPSEIRPYAEYNIFIEAEGYEPLEIEGTEVLPDVTAIQPIVLEPIEESVREEEIFIPDHTLYGEYPAKIPEAEIKPIGETGEIVLSRVVIPEYIIVHDGSPTNASAPNYYVRYRDYIKNVASSEIYATWQESAIYANILVIMSFTLNRVYTEWYRNQGFDFTITSSTAFDQKWVYGRNIFENIDYMVDTVFNNYLSRPGVRQPIFTSYCDGQRVQCNGLSQWGSARLAEQGYSAIEIIRHYYGNDMYINSTDQISGVPSSWPGYELTVGSSGQKVQQMQEQLNRIAQNYTAIPRVTADGIFGPQTQEAVKAFQDIFGLPQSGVADYPTWYEISEIFVGVSRIAEPG